MPTYDLDLDVTWLSMAAAVILPMLTALVTARLAHPGLKSAILALLALVTGAVNELIAQDGVGRFELSSALATGVAVFLGAVGLHYGLLKPSGVTGSQGTIQWTVPGGLGDSGPRDGAHARP